MLALDGRAEAGTVMLVLAPPPPPPPNVPVLKETGAAGQKLPLRELMEQHRANPACAACHKLMDPIGFSLENFDAVGRYREGEGGNKIDATGNLPDGVEFVGQGGLKDAVTRRPEMFVGTTVEKLMTYATGRGLEAYDMPAVREIDPKTGKLTEIPMPELKKGSPIGALSIRMDRDENMWLGGMYQAALWKYNTKTEKLEYWQAPPEWNRPNTQINMTSPMNIGVDGKVWAQNNGFAGVHRIDLASGKWETWEPYKASPQGHNIYDVISDSHRPIWATKSS